MISVSNLTLDLFLWLEAHTDIMASDYTDDQKRDIEHMMYVSCIGNYGQDHQTARFMELWHDRDKHDYRNIWNNK